MKVAPSSSRGTSRKKVRMYSGKRAVGVMRRKGDIIKLAISLDKIILKRRRYFIRASCHSILLSQFFSYFTRCFIQIEGVFTNEQKKGNKNGNGRILLRSSMYVNARMVLYTDFKDISYWLINEPQFRIASGSDVIALWSAFTLLITIRHARRFVRDGFLRNRLPIIIIPPIVIARMAYVPSVPPTPSASARPFIERQFMDR